MKTIILDSNFLMLPFQFKIDIFSELERICEFKYEIAIIDRTIDELNDISKAESKAALKLIEIKQVKLIKTDKNTIVDNLIMDIVDKEKHIVATQDKELKQRLKEKNIPIITLRQKKYLNLQKS
ncbi:hypothetical protein HOA59_02770 [archaeon]|nr:hypothetical protein [archaeon]MBT6824334.1 hypothetical protein [archaeon]MBT7106884.1 hypothetical protein [archaeon]MBT7297436.1 hypothetical protein [archaeon]